jgi:hypothetical protein
VRGFRSKLILLFIVYFAGFASAIYMLAPPPENQQRLLDRNEYFDFDSDEFVKSFNSGMHKCVDFGKDAALKTAEYIKEKVNEKQMQRDS